MSLTKAADIFDELPPLEEHEQKKFKVERNSTLDAFFRGLETIIDEPDEPNVEEVCKELPLPKYCARDVEAFSLMLTSEDYKTDSFEYHAGIWLNALIQRCPDKKITIHTYHLNVSLDRIGTDHKSKYLIVNGDVRNYCGRKMKGGIIHVKGNVGYNVGSSMEGGRIIVEENAETFVGIEMEGGRIYLNGSYESIRYHDTSGGNIYHKGKLIVKDGILLE